MLALHIHCLWHIIHLFNVFFCNSRMTWSSWEWTVKHQLLKVTMTAQFMFVTCHLLYLMSNSRRQIPAFVTLTDEWMISSFHCKTVYA